MNARARYAMVGCSLLAVLTGCSDGTLTPDRAPSLRAGTWSVSGTPLFGTASTPNNRPIAAWEPGVLDHYGTSSVVDEEATEVLQEAIASSSWSRPPYVNFGADSYTIYYAQDGDPEYPMADSSGDEVSCPLDADEGWRGVRIPEGARIYGGSGVEATYVSEDTHFTIVDVERNRMYAFYSGSGDSIGVSDGKFISSYRGCDLVSADGLDGPGDAAIAAASTAEQRYGCGAAGSCGLPAGSGVACSGGGFGSGDSNGFIGGHGVIMPQDFDDAGWTGVAVGTLHHALRCGFPSGYQYGSMWPMQGNRAGTSGMPIRDGQIVRLDPEFDVESVTGGSSPTAAQRAARRVMKTLQVYGCVISDFANYGMALHALTNFPGAGPARPSASPWSAEAGASAEAQAFNAGESETRWDVASSIDMTRLQMVLPHGATFPER
jgi:hypothetical protein